MKWRMIMTIVLLIIVHRSSGQEIRFIHIEHWGGAVLLRWEGVSEKERSHDNLYRAYDESFLRAGLELELNGYVYHPNLLSFHLRGSLVQNRSDIQVEAAGSLYNTTDNTYDLTAEILKKKPVHGQLYASRSVESAGRAFLGRYYNRVQATGATLFAPLFRSGHLQLDVNRRQNRYDSLTFRERRETSNNINLRTVLFRGEQANSSLDVQIKDYEEEVFNVAYRSLQAFGSLQIHLFEGKGRYQGSIRFYRLDGLADLNTITVSNQYRHGLTERLILDGYLNLNRSDTNGVQLDQNVLSVALNHRLYESLNSRVALTGREEDGPGGRLNTTMEQVALDYHKRIPTGSLNIGLGETYQVFANHGTGELTQGSLTSEFDVSDTLTLTVSGLDPSSLVITDPTLSIVYVAGVDYEVIVLQDSVVITRIPGAAIPSGARVTVTYTRAGHPDYRMNVHEHQENFQVRFLNVFRAGYRVRSSDNRLDSDFHVVPFEVFTSRRRFFGVDTRHLAAEVGSESYLGSVSRYTTDSWRAMARFTFFKRCRVSVSLSGNRTDFQNIPHYADLQNRHITFSWVARNGLTLDVNYQDLSYETNYYERDRESISARFQWQFRKLMLVSRYEYILDDTDVTSRRHSYYVVSVRRRF